jgi:surface polysaccharide O-acyltransferase-like enzyme
MKKTVKKREEISFIHYARITACLAVIGIHTVSTNTLYLGKIPWYEWWSAIISDTALIWAVPLFIMISGALLLNPEKQESIKVFYLKRVKTIGVPLVFWTIFYFVFNHFFRGDPIDPLSIARKIILQQPFDNLYFLFIILELYIITPFLRGIIAQISNRQVFFLSCLFLFIGIFWRFQRFVGTMFVPYIGYYLLGWYLMLIGKQQEPEKKNKRFLIGLFFLLVGGIAGMTYLFASHRVYNYGDDFFWFHHTNPLVIGLAVVVFLLFQQFQWSSPPVEMKFVRTISRATLGVYVLHWPVRLLLLYYLFDTKTGLVMLPSWCFVPLAVGIFGISFLLTKIIQQVPVLRNVV